VKQTGRLPSWVNQPRTLRRFVSSSLKVLNLFRSSAKSEYVNQRTQRLRAIAKRETIRSIRNQTFGFVRTRHTVRLNRRIALRLALLRLVLPGWPSPPLHFGHPLRWSAATFSLSATDPFEHDDCLFDVLRLGAEFGQHFVDVHRGYDRTDLGDGNAGSADDGVGNAGSAGVLSGVRKVQRLFCVALRNSRFLSSILTTQSRFVRGSEGNAISNLAWIEDGTIETGKFSRLEAGCPVQT